VSTRRRSFVGSVALPVCQRRLHRDRPHRLAPYLPIGTRPGRPCGGWVTDANVSVPQRRTWPRSMIENACAPHAAHSTRSGCSLASRRHRLPHSQTISYSCVRPVTTMVYQDPRSPSRKLARALPANGTCRPRHLRDRKMALPVAHRRGYNRDGGTSGPSDTTVSTNTPLVCRARTFESRGTQR
jgi:hypothetical protein